MTAPGLGGLNDRNVNIGLDANVDPYTNQVNHAARETNALADSVDRLGQRLDGLSGRAGRRLISISAADVAMLGLGTTAAVRYESTLSTLNATSKITGQSQKGFSNDVEGLTRKFPIARGEAAQLVTSLTNLGVTGTEKVGKLADTYERLSKASGENVLSLAQDMNQLSRQMGNTDADEIAKYANDLLTVSKDAGVSAGGVLQFAQAIAPAARAAHMGQAAVIGISSSFTKAGADGYVAANTFNSIITNITKDIATGSPDIQKYANLLGMTNKQFVSLYKNDPSGVFAKIFDAIAKQGPQAINTLDQLGIDGVRAQQAILAVTQQHGGLQSAIDKAVGSSTNTDNLQKGSKAALGGVADQFQMLRNSSSQFGVEIGTTFLRPIEVALGGVNRLFNALNLLVKPFAPIIAVAGTAAAVVGGLGGAALLTAGLIGKVAIGRLLLGSAPARMGIEGLRSARNPETTRASTVAAMNRFTGGQMRWWQRAPYQAGLAVGGLLPAAGEPRPAAGGGVLSRGGNAALAAPFRLARAAIQGQRELLQNSALPWDQRRAPVLGALGQTASVLRHPLQARQVVATARSDASAGLRGGAAVAGGAGEMSAWQTRLRASTLATAAKTKADEGEISATRLLTREVLSTVAALVKLEATTLRAGAGQVTSGLGALGRAGGRAAVGGLASAAQAAPSLAAAAGRSLYGMLGPIGVGFAGVMAYQSLQANSKKNSNWSETDTALDQLNQKLGLATDKLAGFASGLANATGSDTQKWKTAGTVTDADVSTATAGNYKPSTQLAGALAAHNKTGSTAAAVTALRSMDLSDPKQLGAMKLDLIHSYGKDQAGQILEQYMKDPAGVPDYTATGHQIGQTEGKGSFGVFGGSAMASQSKSGQVIGRNALEGIDRQRGATIAKYGENNTAGTAVADQQKLQSVLQLVQGISTTNNTGSWKAINSVLEQAYGKNARLSDSAQKALMGTSNPNQRKELLAQYFTETAGGSGALNRLGKEGGAASLSQLGNAQAMQQLQALAGANRSGALAGGAAPGTLGYALGRNQTYQTAITTGTQNPNDQYQARAAVFSEALKEAGGDLSKVTRLLDDFGTTLTGTSADVVQSARAYARQQQGFQLPTLSRSAQLNVAASNYQQTLASDPNNPNYQQNVDADKQGLESSKESYRGWMIQMIQMARAYATQMQDMAADRNKQLARGERDFGIQMAQADADYQKSRLRGEAAFSLQMSQSQADRQKSVMRSNRDFAIQLSRQAQSSAQSIYDPYARVVAQYTVDAGTEVQTLQDQNQRLAQQMSQLRKARQMGLSQQSIDTLKLGDAGNAQQLNSLVDSLSQNPELTAQINKQVAQRVKVTAALTQNNFSETFRNTVSDFNRSMRDSAKDYQTSQSRARAAETLALSQMATDFEISRRRAAEANRRGLGDMAADYATMVARSRRDLSTSLTEVTGSFGSAYANMLGLVSGSLRKFAPDAAGIIIKSVDEVKKAHPELFPGYVAPPASADKAGKAYQAPTRGQRGVGYALGGVLLTRHVADVAESGPELALPLNERGHHFMAGMYSAVAKQVAQQLAVAGRGVATHGAGVAGNSVTYVDSSTTFSGAITVQASDPAQLARQLQAKARLLKLTRPPRSTAA